MNLVYFEDAETEHLNPLTWLRAAFELCCGRDRLIDKVRAHVRPVLARLLVRPALEAVVGERIKVEAADPAREWCLLNARALITRDVQLPRPGVAWLQSGQLVAAGLTREKLEALTLGRLQGHEAQDEWLRDYRVEALPEQVTLVRHYWDLVLRNEDELRRQLEGGGGVDHGQVYAGAHLVQPADIHIAAGARVKPGAVLDAEGGPVHIGEGALIEPTAVVQGPCYVGPRSIVRPGAVLRGGTTIGPVCKVGGEIEGSIILGYSNKQHDGFLGHSYVAKWVNLGADTVTSDLKNTYGTIRVYVNGIGVESGHHFIGAVIGDHAKTGIGTILPTGCVVGVVANVFTHRSIPKFVPSFAWLTDAGLAACRVEKAVQIARTVMGRREIELTDADRRLLEWTASAARQVEAAGWPAEG